MTYKTIICALILVLSTGCAFHGRDLEKKLTQLTLDNQRVTDQVKTIQSNQVKIDGMMTSSKTSVGTIKVEISNLTPNNVITNKPAILNDLDNLDSTLGTVIASNLANMDCTNIISPILNIDNKAIVTATSDANHIITPPDEFQVGLERIALALLCAGVASTVVCLIVFKEINLAVEISIGAIVVGGVLYFLSQELIWFKIGLGCLIGGLFLYVVGRFLWNERTKLKADIESLKAGAMPCPTH